MATKTPDVTYIEEEAYKAYDTPTVDTTKYNYTAPTLEYEATNPDYKVDYNSDQFQKVEADKEAALTQNSQVYGDMIAGADKFYTDLQNQHMEWADKQAQIQQENTDFTIEKIEQQKEQAQKDYLKEQSGAYVDWQKQSNRYGVEAERQASVGLDKSGYSESSQVAMYNQYQNRVATAREVLAQAKLNYDNGIREAMLQNNAALAEIYATAYLKQAELALEGFQYKNQLLIEQSNKQLEIDQMYYDRWQDVLQQINTENAMAEEIRQYNETMKWNTEKANIDNQIKIKEAELDRQFQADMAAIEMKFKDYQAYLEREFEKKMLNAETQAKKDLLEQEHKNALEKIEKERQEQEKLLAQEHANALAKIEKERQEQEKLLKYQYDLQKQSIGTVSGGGTHTSSSGNIHGGSSGSITSGSVKGFTGSSYKEAVSFMKANGVPSSNASAAMTESEWSRRRNSYSMTGQGGTEVKNYSSYKAYIQDYVAYCVEKFGK